MHHFNYLIIGQGIAGTLLTHFLLKRGKKVLVCDSNNPSSASNVAAGLCNPVTGKRLVKTWMADEIFPFAESTYMELETILNTPFWNKTNIFRTISEDEKVFLKTKIETPDLAEWIIPANCKWQGLKCETFLKIKGGGYLNMPQLISKYRKKLKNEGRLVEQDITAQDLNVEEHLVTWGNRSFDKVIFCEGYKAIKDPYFSWLPFVLAKGETITIKSEELIIDQVVMKDIFILPLGNFYFKIGSTYQWDNLNEFPTLKGKTELLEKLEQLLESKYSIVGHEAGIRPAVKDRKPLIGLHPLYKSIGIFNGLGAKGASLAPYFAHHFAEFLELGVPLLKDIDINRFSENLKPGVSSSMHFHLPDTNF